MNIGTFLTMGVFDDFIDNFYNNIISDLLRLDC